MPYAKIVATSKGSSGANVASQALSNPAGASVGDLVIHIFCANDQALGETALSIGGGSGWTEVLETSYGRTQSACYWKRLDGTGDTLTVNLSVSYEVSWYSFRITTGADATAPEFAVATSNTDVADPPSLNPAGWGTEDTLWIAAGCANDSRNTPTAYPSGYTDGDFEAAGEDSRASTIAVCRRNLNAASENPGAFSWESTGNNGHWWTIAVRSAAHALSGAASARIDATAVGARLSALSGTIASRLDATATGQRLYWSFKIRLDADATGEVFSGAINHALSGALAARLDADAVGTRSIPLSASLASRLDADAEGDVTSILFLSGTLAARLDAEAAGAIAAAITGSLAIRLDATAEGLLLPGGDVTVSPAAASFVLSSRLGAIVLLQSTVSRRCWTRLRDELTRGLGGPNYDGWRETAERILADAQLDMATLYSIPDLESFEDFSLAPGETSHKIGDDVLQITAVIDTSSWRPLERRHISSLQALPFGGYAVFGRSLLLGAPSETTRSFRAYHLRYPTPPDFDLGCSTFPEIAERWDGHLLERALMKGAAKRGMDSIAEKNQRLLADFFGQSPARRTTSTADLSEKSRVDPGGDV